MQTLSSLLILILHQSLLISFFPSSGHSVSFLQPLHQCQRNDYSCPLYILFHRQSPALLLKYWFQLFFSLLNRNRLWLTLPLSVRGYPLLDSHQKQANLYTCFHYSSILLPPSQVSLFSRNLWRLLFYIPTLMDFHIQNFLISLLFFLCVYRYIPEFC